MLGIAATKWILVLLLFMVLPIALMRYLVRETIEAKDRNQRQASPRKNHH